MHFHPSLRENNESDSNPARLNERILWERNSAPHPKLTDPISLFTLVLHKIQLRWGWWALPLQVLAQLELLSPQSLLSAEDGSLQYQKKTLPFLLILFRTKGEKRPD